MSKIGNLISSPPERQLSIFLWLVMLHSLGIGLGLLFMPSFILEIFGFSFDPLRFFVSQGGAFHLVMVICYGLAAWDVLKHRSLVILAISAKFLATVFLVTYFLAVDQVLVILVSGVGDFIMGIIVLILYRQLFYDGSG